MKKGFTLTLSMIIILIFLTTIITVETQKVNIEEQTHSQHSKFRVINSILLDLNSSAFDYSLSRIGKRSMFNVINEEIAYKIYVNDAEKAICDEFTKNFHIYLEDSLGQRLGDTGLDLDVEPITCSVELIDAFNVNLTTSVNLIFTEENKIKIQKKIDLNTNFSIEGLPDPFIAIESYKEGNTYDPIIRPIILSPLYKDNSNWENNGNLKIEKENILYSKGWMYGKLVEYTDIRDSSYYKEIKGNLLLIPSHFDQDQLSNAIEFAKENGVKGIVLQNSIFEYSYDVVNFNPPGHECIINYTITTFEISEPCIVCGTTKTIEITESTCESHDCSMFTSSCKKISDTEFEFSSTSSKSLDYSGFYAIIKSNLNIAKEGKYVLFDGRDTELQLSGNSGKVYNIERQRSAILCGNYFLNENAPDIFSRMEGRTKGDVFGIETFVLGTWALEDYSKLDHQYYSKTSGYKVKGMLGCLSKDMCDTDITGIGAFTLNNNDLKRYGMGDIYVR